MNFKKFKKSLVKKFDKNFSKFGKKIKNLSKKEILIFSLSFLFVLSALAFFSKGFGENSSASVMQLWLSSRKGIDSCVDTDGGKNYYEKGTIITVINGYQRVEQDSCNTDGTLRERFCGQPGHPAGLLRSENFVQCEHGCNDGACVEPTTGNVVKDIAIQGGEFVALNSTEAELYVNVKNIGNVTMSINGFGHDLFLDSNSSNIPMGGNYTVEIIQSPTMTLQPNQEYTFSVIMRLQNNHQFTYDSKLNVSVFPYPETDDNIIDNEYTFYMTGNILNKGNNVVNKNLMKSLPIIRSKK